MTTDNDSPALALLRRIHKLLGVELPQGTAWQEPNEAGFWFVAADGERMRRLRIVVTDLGIEE